MITKPDRKAIRELSKEQRIELLELVSESLVDDLPPLSKAQTELLNARLAKHKANPRGGKPLHEVLARLRSRK